MKINVLGRGKVPGINALAPVYNREADITMIKRILAFRTFRVFSSDTGLQITSKNVNEYANVDQETVVKIPHPTIKADTTTPSTKTVAPKVEKVEPVLETPTVEDITPVEESVVEQIVEEIVPEDEPTSFTEELVTDTVVEEAQVPEQQEEEVKSDNNYRSKRNKKKRHNDNK